ncbi:MAG: hypothetical protein LBT96_02060, partial [Campylobacteraceae bacterium]|nr:hypothetical protein [Campylobacteraceae bacterium]
NLINVITKIKRNNIKFYKLMQDNTCLLYNLILEIVNNKDVQQRQVQHSQEYIVDTVFKIKLNIIDYDNKQEIKEDFKFDVYERYLIRYKSNRTPI